MSERPATTSASGKKSLLPKIFAGMSLLLIGIFVYLVLAGKDGQFLMLLAALVALLGSRVDDIVSLQFGAQGVSTELERKIQEAQATITELQALATTWASLSAELIYGSGRWGGMSRGTKRELIAQISKTLETVGVNADDVVSKVRYKYDHFDYAHAVFAAGPSHSDAAWNEALKAHSATHKGIGNEAGPDELEEMFRSHQRLTDEVREALEDYRFYERTKQHRRSEI
ncbi:hypothetical protein [Rhizobium sp. FKY42]|uniref:hypothetical protein n=1 Tax=Rhizobium sp. FKY42 TaxID=2562310 RepID=UPI0010C11AAB|nr:hypothetical protein [Rhizobium sp. FKY42]